MSKFVERMFFFVFTPLGALASFIGFMTTEPDPNAQTSGATIGWLIGILMPIWGSIVLGLFFRSRRIKTERKIL